MSEQISMKGEAIVGDCKFPARQKCKILWACSSRFFARMSAPRSLESPRPHKNTNVHAGHQYQFLLAMRSLSLCMFCTKVSSYVRLARARIKNYEAIYQAECAVSLLLRAGVEINPKIWPPPDDFGAEKQVDEKGAGGERSINHGDRAGAAQKHTRARPHSLFFVCGRVEI